MNQPTPVPSPAQGETRHDARGMPLVVLLTLLVNGIVLVAFIGFGAFMATVQVSQRTLEIERDTLYIANSTAAGAANDLLLANYDNLEALLLRQGQIGNLDELLIAEADGTVLSRVRRDVEGELRVIYAATPAIDLGRDEVREDRYYTRLIPIDRGQRLGWVRASYSLESLGQIKRDIWRDTLSAGLVTMLIVALMLWLVVRYTSRQVEAISGFAVDLIRQRGGRLSSGGLIREIVVLKGALNEASETLSFQYQALVESKAEQQRTNEMLQQTVGDLANQQYALDQHAIVSMTSADGTMFYANERLEALSGYTAQELIGNSSRLLKSGIQDDAFYRSLWQTITNGNVWHGEYANRRKDGSIYWVAATIVPMLGENGRPHQYISIQTDISEQKRTEHQLEQYRQNLERTIQHLRETQFDLAQATNRELAIGHQIQRNLLFGNVPDQVGQMAIVTFTEPSQGIDGDFYEFFRHGPQCFDIAIGDVMGKGVIAALIGAAVKQMMNRVLAEQLSVTRTGITPAAEDLFNGLHQRITPRLIDLESFVTMAYARIDLERGLVSLINAGHTQVILIDAGGQRLLSGDNLPLGVLEDERYRQHDFEISSNSLMFLYSDGFTEARADNGEEFGVERLAGLLEDMQRNNIPLTMIVQAVRMAIYDFEASHLPSDDRTCIALQLNSDQEPGHRNAGLDLVWALSDLGRLRQLIEAECLQAGFAEEDATAFILAAFEAATNIIRHATLLLPDSVLHARLQTQADWLALDLFYPCAKTYVPDDTTPDFSGESEGGFGLFIIRSNVDELTYDSPAPGICRTHLGKRMSSQADQLRDDERNDA